MKRSICAQHAKDLKPQGFPILDQKKWFSRYLSHLLGAFFFHKKTSKTSLIVGCKPSFVQQKLRFDKLLDVKVQSVKTSCLQRRFEFFLFALWCRCWWLELLGPWANGSLVRWLPEAGKRMWKDEDCVQPKHGFLKLNLQHTLVIW